MNRGQRRMMEKMQKRKAAQADHRRKEWNNYIEKMYAAYLKETKIPSAQALLCHEKVQDPENTSKITDKYWFEHHEERVKIVDTHPDIQFLFTLCSELVRASKIHHEDGTTYGDSVRDGLGMLEDFMTKYENIVEKEIEEEYGK